MSDEPAGGDPQPPGLDAAASPERAVPRAFLNLAEAVACHRAVDRWERLYCVLWRLTHGEPQLLKVSTDDDMRRLQTLAAAVRRDAHKMKAFVRFRRVVGPGGGEAFVAWPRPDHCVLRLTAPFFADRFGVMAWAILTPDESAFRDRRPLTFGAGVAGSPASRADELEGLRKAYDAAVFDPARANEKAMRRELPARHWPIPPEAEPIPDLLREAPRRESAMIEA